MPEHHGLQALKAAIADRIGNLGPQGAGSNAEVNPKAAPAKTYKDAEYVADAQFTRTHSVAPDGGFFGFQNRANEPKKFQQGFGKKGRFKGGGKGKAGPAGKFDVLSDVPSFLMPMSGGYGYETSLKGDKGGGGGKGKGGGGMAPMMGMGMPGFNLFDPAMAAAALAPMMMPMLMTPQMMMAPGAPMPGQPAADGAAPSAASAGAAAEPAGGEADSGTKLFVGNLPGDIDESAMQTVFGSYGKVQAIALMRNKDTSNGNGQASAFVIYETEYEAKTAINTLHDKYEIRPGEGPISVRQAQPKNSKRANPY